MIFIILILFFKKRFIKAERTHYLYIFENKEFEPDIEIIIDYLKQKINTLF
jgi:hypothetical protein